MADPNRKLVPGADRRRPVLMGAFVESYPVSAWTRIPKDVSLDDLWQIIGPQVDKHLNTLPLWKVFCVVYFEGLIHGAAVADSRSPIPSQDTP